MMALLGVFASSFTVALSGALMPGPLLTLNISEASRRGFWAGPRLIAGHAVLELTLLLVLFAGLGPFIRTDIAFSLIGVIGAVVLFWMAAGNLRAVPTLTLNMAARRIAARQSTENATISGGTGAVATSVSGALVSLSNPYWSVWWATIGIASVNLAMPFGIPGVAAFYLGHILADLLWYSLISFGIARSRQYMTDRIYRVIVAVCSLFLIGMGLWFGYRGVERALGTWLRLSF